MEELLQKYNDTLARIVLDENHGLITPEQAEFAKQNLKEEFEEMTADFAFEDEDMADFSAGNSLGVALLELGEESGYEDPEEFLVDLSDALGVDPEVAYDLITSDEEFDEDVIEDVVARLEAAYEADAYDDGEEEFEEEDELEDEYDDEYEEDEEFEEEPELEEASYSAYDPRIEELQDEVAEFKAQSLLKSTLADLDREAQELVANGDLPSHGYEILFTNELINSEEDRVACFAAMAEQNQNTINEELIKVKGILDFMRELSIGETGLFSELVNEDYEANFGQEVDPEEEAEVQATAEYYLKKVRK